MKTEKEVRDVIAMLKASAKSADRRKRDKLATMMRGAITGLEWVAGLHPESCPITKMLQARNPERN